MFHKNNTFYFCVLCNFLYIFPVKAYFTPVLKKAKIKHTRQVDYFSAYVTAPWRRSSRQERRGVLEKSRFLIYSRRYMMEYSSEKPRQELQPNCVVGIGASAGGLEALQQFLTFLPGNTGMAFVIIQHLASFSILLPITRVSSQIYWASIPACRSSRHGMECGYFATIST